MVWSVFPYENDFISITSEDINGIPCLKFRPKAYMGLLPTVIDYHGWHSNKDFKRFEAMVVASHGYQVITPDALYHGDREAIDHDDPKNLDKYLWEIVLQSVKESPELIKQIIDKHQADPERIGVIGGSMGAITAGGVFVSNPGLKCLVGLIGTFAWQEAVKRSHLPAGSPEDKRLIELYDPMNNKDKFNKRAVLMLNGAEDTSLPSDSQRIFFSELLPLYEEVKEKLQFMEVANLNHYVTTGMLEKAVMWFKEHL